MKSRITPLSLVCATSLLVALLLPLNAEPTDDWSGLIEEVTPQAQEEASQDVSLAMDGDLDVSLDFESDSMDVIEDDLEQDDLVLDDSALITVNYPDEPIRRILRNVADLYDLNLVVPDTLVGNASVKLRDINWRTVYDIILKPVGFTFAEEANVIRIVSIEEINREPMELRTFPIKYAKASDLALSLGPIISSDGSGGSIQVDTRSNSIIARGRPSALNEVEQLLKTSTIDKPSLQVMIEAKFLEVSKETNSGEKDGVGLDWWADKAMLGAGNNILRIKGMLDLFNSAAGSTFESVVLSGAEYAMALTALQTTSSSNLLGNPTVVTLNNQEASFHVGRKQPIIEANFDTTTGNYTVGEVDYLDLGVKLSVTPRVNAGADQITLSVEPEVIKKIGDVDFGGASNGIIKYPITTVRTTRTNVSIKNGYTLALGGLIQDDDINETKKVPLLGDIPFVGRIFQRNVNTAQKTNLIMFITAKTLNSEGATYHEVIDPRQIASMGISDADIPGYANGVDMPGMSKMSEQHRQLLMELKSKRHDCYNTIALRDAKIANAKTCSPAEKSCSKNTRRINFGHNNTYSHANNKRHSYGGRGL